MFLTSPSLLFERVRSGTGGVWVPTTLSQPADLVALCRTRTLELGIWLREGLTL